MPPYPLGSPAHGATVLENAGNFSSLMSSMSLIAPSMTMPLTPFPMAEHVASSPHTATGAPPTSTTRTSPSEALSIASTGFAQSPLDVCTVSARPTILCLCWIDWGTIPNMTPCLWNASEMLHVETLENASKRSSSEYFLARSVFILAPAMALFTFSAAPLMSSVLIIAPPTMTSDAPASTYCPAFSAVIPPATATGMETASTIFLRMSIGGSAPFIWVSMPIWRQM